MSTTSSAPPSNTPNPPNLPSTGGANASAASGSGTKDSNGAPYPEYVLNERVLCYHGPLMYEAKVLKVQNMEEPSQLTGKTGMHYFVHYKGWKQTWDEWVHASRLLKHDDKGLELQKTLKAAHDHPPNLAAPGLASVAAGGPGKGAAAHAGGAGSKHGGGAAAGGTSASGRQTVRKDARGTKRSRDEDDAARKPEMKLIVPEMLKRQLVNDWEWVTKHCMTVPFPRNPTVVEILKEFAEYVVSENPSNLKDPNLLLPTITSGLQTYFDKAFGNNLLYRFERKQYSEARIQYVTGKHVQIGVTEKEMSEVFGAEHFLRMMVSLPGMIAQSTLDPESVALIKEYANELLRYMDRERERLFLTQEEYEYRGADYQNQARS
ncbi:hypothetical protein D9611_002976 [Ephemerocybe angulata]|uniref:Chromatin modification-related protein EAF3 n=1 Tax=Ephemerocybe angulata TaxID=980116 RepID=A0A8H5C8W6_9AGAR|nr:hypothetical protein D9611_002976 [Tulosesus angulatus]